MLLTGKKKKKKTSLFFFLLIFGVKQSWKHSNIWFKPLRVSVLTASYKLFKEEKIKLADLAKTQLTQRVRFDALNISDTLLIENRRRAHYLGIRTKTRPALSWRCARWFFGLWTPSAAGSPAVGRFGKHLAPSGVQKASLARTHTCPIKSHWPDANSNEPESLPVSHGGSGVITPWRCFYSSRECSSAPDVTHGRLLTVVCDVLSGTMPTGG